MATLETKVQELIDKINTHGQTPAETALIAAAIHELTSHQKFQQALLAVADEDLTDAITALTDAKDVLTTALTEAQAALIASDQAGVNALDNAVSTINQELTKLDVIPQLTNQLDRIEKNLPQKVQPYAYLLHSPSPNARRSPLVYAIYDKPSGNTYAILPAYSYSSSPNNNLHRAFAYCFTERNENIQMDAWYIDNNTYTSGDSPANLYMYQHLAMVPLARVGEPTSIAYTVVYDEQTAPYSSHSHYGGVRVDGRPSAERVKLKHGINVIDQYGLEARTNSGGSRQFANNRLLYDNTKHCLLAIQQGTNELVEIYQDGIVRTGQFFADSASYQAFVQGKDFVVVPFICNNYSANHPAFKMGGVHAAISGNPHLYDNFGNTHSVHYCFEDNRLQPLLMTQQTQRQPSNNAIVAHYTLRKPDGALVVDCMAELISIQSAADPRGTMLLAVNPYSGQALGLMDTFYYESGAYHYGFWKGKLK